jgi:hypothetical protein
METRVTTRLESPMKAEQVKVGVRVKQGTACGVIVEVSKIPPFRIGVDFCGHFRYVLRRDLELEEAEPCEKCLSTQDPSSNNYRRWGYGP